MAEQTAQYDHIGSKYDEYAQTATQKRAERYTVLRMVGPLAGQRVLDLACGFGFYTRLLKQRNAALKTQGETVAVWDADLARSGEAITE